jgi:hypothetical protein
MSVYERGIRQTVKGLTNDINLDRREFFTDKRRQVSSSAMLEARYRDEHHHPAPALRVSSYWN